MTAQTLYAVWAALGPLIGVIVGGLLTAWWQRRQWILDNKKAEYRELLDALSAYRWRLLNYQAKYGTTLIENECAGDPVEKSAEKIALAEAMTALDNDLADRIFAFHAIEECGISEDMKKFQQNLISRPPPTIDETTRSLLDMRRKVLQTAQRDLKLKGGLVG